MLWAPTMTSDKAELLVTNQDGVMWLKFNRPNKANALSLQVLTELNRALKEAATRSDVRAVVITGAGERTFSAGADLSSPPGDAAAHQAKRRTEFSAALMTLVDFRKPIVAAVNCAACGAGMMIPLLFDAVVAADSAP